MSCKTLQNIAPTVTENFYLMNRYILTGRPTVISVVTVRVN